MNKIVRFLSIASAMIIALAPAYARKVKKVAPKEHTTVEIPKVTKQVIAVETSSTQLILLVNANGTVQTCHYGRKIADPNEFLNYNSGLGSLYGDGAVTYPAQGGRFISEPALSVKYADGYRNTELYFAGVNKVSKDLVNTTEVLLKDYVTGLEVKLVYDAYLKEDVILSHSEITNAGKAPVTLIDYASSSMYVRGDKFLLTHTYGDWSAEMQIDREVLTHNIKVIETKRGTQATQWNNPSFMLSLNTDSFSETDGDVIAGSLAWSGNFRISFEKDVTHNLNVVAGINPFSSEYELAQNQTFITPDMIWTFSSEGAGQASRNIHAWARNFGVYGGAAIKPTLLNSWEGAYFSFNTETLLRMIDDAAAMGLEMFVLDDGWFAMDYPRDSDKQGLGDWEVNTKKIPEGIDYIASYAHSKGLKFGIWIEPEMANPKSNLAKNHPDWIVRSPGREIYQHRNQWLLDLSNPDVQDFVYGVFDNTMQLSKNIDYIKFDSNRPVYSYGSDYLGKDQSKFYVDYVQGLYNIMRRVREKYPDTIVQCCSSGGARVDYGSLKYFNEYWASDDTDAMERIKIQYGTSLFYPACTIASHVSAVPNHQTTNVTSLKFRFDVACSGRLGMELQPKNLTEEERAFADRCITSYKSWRDLVFAGDLYRISSPYESDYYALMYVSEDKSRAVVFTYCANYLNRAIGTKTFTLQGLDPSKKYKVTEQNVDKSIFSGNGKTLSGEYLMNGGFNIKLFKTMSSAVFYLEAQ